MKSNKFNGLRHGENLLLPVNDVTGKVTQHTAYIVGHSETGHHHVLESKEKFDVIVKDDELYLRLFNPASLVHKKTTDKHKTLLVKPGTYKVHRKTEYDPWNEVIREVFD